MGMLEVGSLLGMVGEICVSNSALSVNYADDLTL